MKEMLSIFDKSLKPIGVKEREKVHRDGDWHETFHCWFYERQHDHTFIFLQKRADDKKDFPGLYDITAAGHLEAGEDLLTGGIREVEEELGILPQREGLEYIGFYKEELVSGQFKDREICHLYLYPFPSNQPFLLGEEVSDVVKVELEDFLCLLSKKRLDMLAYSVITGDKTSLLSTNLVSHDCKYYQYIIQAITEKLASNH